MLNYFKRVAEPSGGAAAGATAPKRPRAQVPSSLGGSAKASTAQPSMGGDPRTIVTWNANGLGVRLGKDWQELRDFLTTVKPDLCCIQEVNATALFRGRCDPHASLRKSGGELFIGLSVVPRSRPMLVQCDEMRRPAVVSDKVFLGHSALTGTHTARKGSTRGP